MSSHAGRWGVLILAVALFLSAGAAQEGARYLMITADEFVDAVQPLAEWKTLKGMLAKVVPVSTVGNNGASIQTYIRNAYTTWPVPPEYIVLVGSPTRVVSYNGSSDCPYGDMGGDYLMELPVGRLPATSVRECSTQVAKVLAYERPSMVDTTWFLKATTTVREDHQAADDSIYWSDSRLLLEHCRRVGYTTLDSMSASRGNNSADVDAAANDGRTFITFRGQGVGSWWTPFDNINPFSWTNGEKMPIVVAGTCATMNLSDEYSMYGEQFARAGSPSGAGGAICYFGTTGVTSHGAQYRSAVHVGFVDALFREKQYRLGPATVRGRFKVDSLYHQQSRYTEWNLYGDPELNVWTRGVPDLPAVDYPAAIIMAPQDFQVTVRVSGSPLLGANVCVSMDSTVYAWGMTDHLGMVELAISPAHIGTMNVVVTGAGLLPALGTCQVTAGSVPYVVVDDVGIEDYAGNGDGIVNPGERMRLHVALANLGGVTASGVGSVLRCDEPGVTLRDSTATFGTILPDSQVEGDPLDVELGTGFTEGSVVPLSLIVWDDQGDTWSRPLDLLIRAGALRFVEATLLDEPPGGNGNGRLGRGEGARLEVAIANAGGGRLAGVSAVLLSLDTAVVAVDSTGFYGTAGAGDTLAGEFDRFALSAGPGLLPGHDVLFRIRLAGDGGSYQYADSIDFTVEGEQGTTTEPTGPDAYGYWCYDDTDTPSGRAPEYDWLELSGGTGTVIDSVSDNDAATVTIPLPFGFKYYGVDYDSLSVCSNGFLVPGRTTYAYGANRPLPDTTGAAAMVAAFWDDLNPDERTGGNGTAYQYYDAANHRFMVEFGDFSHYNQPSIRETFQAVFYDPAYHSTPTGDGDIVFLYNRVALGSGCTIGIEDHTETRAIQYVYNNSYPATAAYLQTGRAIRFTTLAPLNTSDVWLVPAGVAASDSAYGDNDGRFEPGETLTVVVTIRNLGTVEAANAAMVLRAIDPDAALLDSAAGLGTIAPGSQSDNSGEPFSFIVAQLPEDSIVDFELALAADGYQASAYFSVGLAVPAALEEGPGAGPLRTALERVYPNPARRAATVRYGLARRGFADLALFDATGRRVRTLASGVHEAGWYSAPLEPDGMSQGVYFCRLTVSDGAGEQRFVSKVQFLK